MTSQGASPYAIVFYFLFLIVSLYDPTPSGPAVTTHDMHDSSNALLIAIRLAQLLACRNTLNHGFAAVLIFSDRVPDSNTFAESDKGPDDATVRTAMRVCVRYLVVRQVE